MRLRLRSVLTRGEEETDAGGRSNGTVRDDWGLFAFLIIFYRRGERLARRWWWLPGWAFAAVTQLPALLAVAWLVRRSLAKKKSSGCGGDCGCPASEVKAAASEIARRK